MSLPNGNTPILPGKLAAIGTIMEMRAEDRQPLDPVEAMPEWRFERVLDMELSRYLALYRAVGRDHLWYGRLVVSEAEITALVASPEIAIFVLTIDGEDAGLAELDLSRPGSCEIVYFGVQSAHIGSGAARFMMERVIAFAFEQNIERLWLHTNTNDHPRAMRFYRRKGFRPVSQFLELTDDPRLIGLYEESAAPRIPIFRSSDR
ncbi:GNAT family N-acetyltransferase [Fulvimarina sp. MAC3]|uniref:GNAT family N-acetyltransferase n=1 Tax=Fulvimarina sp. MAC3 TaxID=3148887 RepID=UPI0031FCF88F